MKFFYAITIFFGILSFSGCSDTTNNVASENHDNNPKKINISDSTKKDMVNVGKKEEDKKQKIQNTLDSVE